MALPLVKTPVTGRDDAKALQQEMYCPIQPYQTRLVQLHGDEGTPDSQLVCSLFPAYILATKFNGLGLRMASGEDRLTEYDALSYTWGTEDKTETILCNGVELPITANLFQALRMLRPSAKERRYLWVDAICINQADESEKSDQVWNMLHIYQTARKVMAWLGPSSDAIHKALIAVSGDISKVQELGFWSICRGISQLYMLPWFNRMWIQQEVFAARELSLSCGSLELKLPLLFSYPRLLLELPHLQPYKAGWLNHRGEVSWDGDEKHLAPEDIFRQLEAVSELDSLRCRHLKCFQLFSQPGRHPPDLVDTLLDTAMLRVTDPRDHIYAILGMTEFPAKSMTVQEWTIARQHEVFVPIDYSADLSSILCAVTWAVLMQGGLELLVKFKCFPLDLMDGSRGYSPPSWAIDWSLAARAFGMVTHRSSNNPVEEGKRSYKPFRSDNMKSPMPHNKLILRAVRKSEYYVANNSVWQRNALRAYGGDSILWHDESNPLCNNGLYPTDLVIDVLSLNYTSLWLVRPVTGNEFKLLVVLDYVPELAYYYAGWEWNPGSQTDCSQYLRRLRSAPQNKAKDFSSLRTERQFELFTIV